MKNISVTLTGGYTASVPVASSVEEFDKLGKYAGCCLDNANEAMKNWDVLPQWWRQLDEYAQLKTGVPYNTKTNDKGKTVRDESPVKYLARVVALGKTTQAELQKAGDLICAGKLPIVDKDQKPVLDDKKQPTFYSLVFDPSERAAGERAVKATKSDLAVVVELRKSPKFAAAVTKLGAFLGKALDKDSTDEAIAIAIGEKRRADARKAEEASAAALKAALGA